VRTYSQYNEQSYDQFEIAQAANFGAVRPRLEIDGQALSILLNPVSSATASPALTFNGSADFAAASGGYGGSLVLVGDASGSRNLIVTAPGSTTQSTPTTEAISAATIDAFGAPTIYVGGPPAVGVNDVVFLGIAGTSVAGNELYGFKTARHDEFRARRTGRFAAGLVQGTRSRWR
jgi:hypothetical protein